MRTVDGTALVMVLALVGVVPTATSAGDLAAALRACAAERDDVRRLACFDREAAALPQQSTAAPGPAPVTQSAEDRFGLNGQLAAAKAAQQKAPPAPKKLKAKVTGVSSLPRGEFVVTLDSGQVWIEEPPGRYLELAAGDTITLIAGALGSFFLEAPNGRAARVKRVR